MPAAVLGARDGPPPQPRRRGESRDAGRRLTAGLPFCNRGTRLRSRAEPVT
jgi:hypothetical protein